MNYIPVEIKCDECDEKLELVVCRSGSAHYECECGNEVDVKYRDE